MTAPQTEFCPDKSVLHKFIAWIEGFDPRHARMWRQRYKANPESAACEAMYWWVLSDCGVDVEPNADLDASQPAPDFLCRKDNQKFYVEVTCIRIDTATRHTSLEHTPTDSAVHYRPLNDAICKKVESKTRQCADLDAACVLAVGTFHHHASVSCIKRPFMEWLLTGKTSLAWQFDPRRGHAVGESFDTTRFESAAFAHQDSLVGDDPARRPISALLIGGFCVGSPIILGAVHPDPARKFDPVLLNRIPFCNQKVDISAATLSTEWTRDPD